MSQLRALIWLKWRLFRNAFRRKGRGGKANRVASLVTMVVGLAFALLVAVGMGVAAYVVVERVGGGRVYQIKGNQMDTLTVNNSNLSARTAIYIGKANITDPLAPISLGGGNLVVH